MGALEVTLALVLGSAGLAGIGLALAGWLRAEINLAVTNGLYLVLLLLSGIVVPLTSLPSLVRRIVICLPSGAMGEALHRVLGHGLRPSGADWLSLALWAGRGATPRVTNVSSGLSRLEVLDTFGQFA